MRLDDRDVFRDLDEEAFADCHVPNAGDLFVETNRPQPASKATWDDGDLAKRVCAMIGADNLIHVDNRFRRWNVDHGWEALTDTELRKIIQDIMRRLGTKLNLAKVNSVIGLIRTDAAGKNPVTYSSKPPYQVPLANGLLLLDEESLTFREYRRDDLVLSTLHAPYDDCATAPRFERFLREIFEGDADSDEKRQLVLESIGYSLLDTARLETCIFLVGNGANGKSTLLKLLERLLGAEYVAAVAPRKFGDRFQRAALLGKRANIVSELNAGDFVPDGDLKSIVSGDSIQAEFKGHDAFSFQPYCTVWFGTNFLPRVNDTSGAFERRIRVIEFNRKFSEEERSVGLLDELCDELSGIINLALPAIQAAFRRGHVTEPISSRRAKQRWLEGAKHVDRFLHEQCVLRPNGQVSMQQLENSYIVWARRMEIARPLGKRELGKQLDQRGISSYKGTNGCRMRKGVALKQPDEEDSCRHSQLGDGDKEWRKWRSFQTPKKYGSPVC